MATITVTIPDEQATVLTEAHGDLSKWFASLANERFVNENRRVATAAFRSGKVERPEFAKVVADKAREMEAEKPARESTPTRL